MPCPHYIHYNLYQYLSELNAPSFSLHLPPSTSSPHALTAIIRWRLTPPPLTLSSSWCLRLPSPPLTHTSKSFTPFIVRRSSGPCCRANLMEFGGWQGHCQTVTLRAQWSLQRGKKKEKFPDWITSFQGGWAHYSLHTITEPAKVRGLRKICFLFFFFFFLECIKLLEERDSLQFLAQGGEVGDINQVVSNTYRVHQWLARLTFWLIWRDVLVQVFQTIIVSVVYLCLFHY